MEDTHFIPRINHIKDHFAKAKEIRCLNLNVVVNVVSVNNFIYNEKDNSWMGIGGVICFWKNGQFAEITKNKCNPADCQKCKECAEKRKQLKK